MKRIYANWRLKCEENRQLRLTVVGETGPYRGTSTASSWQHHSNYFTFLALAVVVSMTIVTTRLPSNLRPTTHMCMHLVACGHFRSRDKDGGQTIRSARAENPMWWLAILCPVELWTILRPYAKSSDRMVDQLHGVCKGCG